MPDELHAKRPPFVQIPLSWAKALRSTDIHVALVLGGYAGHHGGRAWPSIATLARDTGLSENTVRAALNRLQESKVLTVEHRKHANGRDRSNAYVIDLTGAGLGEGAESEPMGAKSEPSPEGMGAKSEPIEGAKFAPTEGAKFEDDLDQEKNQIHVDPEPHTPPTPSRSSEACVRVSPAAPEQPTPPVDVLALRHDLPPWLDSRRRIDAGFLQHVAGRMPKKASFDEQVEVARGFIRKAERSSDRRVDCLEYWEAYQEKLHHDREQEELIAQMQDLLPPWQRRR